MYLKFPFISPLMHSAFLVLSLLLFNDSEAPLELAMFMGSWCFCATYLLPGIFLFLKCIFSIFLLIRNQMTLWDWQWQRIPFQNFHCYRPPLINCLRACLFCMCYLRDAEFTGMGGRWKESMFSLHHCSWTRVSSWFSSLVRFWGTSASQPCYFRVSDPQGKTDTIEQEQSDQSNAESCVKMVGVVQSMHDSYKPAQ